MRERDLAIAWIALAVVFAIALVWEVGQWVSLSSRGEQAADQRAQLTRLIREKEQEIVREARANSALLQEMTWTAPGAEPAAFIRRVAELAQGTRMKVVSIGPLERQATPQFNKSWHSVQIVGPYQEVRDLLARVEAERGIVEGLVVSEAQRDALLPRAGPGEEPRRPGSGRATEVQAQFRLAAIELTPQAKDVLNRASIASGIPLAPQTAPPPLGLPVPVRAAGGAPLRDPFVYGGAPTVRAVAAEQAPVVIELQGIVSFPGGFLAIVENQIVKVGDKVKGSRVEDITEQGVLLRQPDGTPRRLTLPDIAAPAPRAPPASPAAPPVALPAPPAPPASPGPRR